MLINLIYALSVVSHTYC